MRAHRLHVAIVAVVALALGGCRVPGFGPRVENFELSNSGRGIATRVMLPDRSTLDAELLALRDDGMLVITAAPEIVAVPWRAVRQARFDQLRIEVSHGRAPNAADRETLRRVSRHPEGLDDARLRALLDAYDLNAVREVQP